MTRNEAESIIISRLVINSASHMESAKEMPQLAQNSADACRNNQEAAAAFGIEDQYLARLSQFING